MISVAYQVKGVDVLLRDLAGVRLDRLQPELDSLIDDMASAAAMYPPEIAGQRYVRTGDLGRGWTDGATQFPQSGPTMLEALRENSVAYAPYVQGAEDQATVHRGRWQTTDALMAAWEDRAAQRIEGALDKILP